MAVAELNDAHYIQPEQLCIGLYVHLDLSWTQHPFTFSSFRIRNQGQIDTLRSLGLTRIRYIPEKSEAEPLPPAPQAAETHATEASAVATAPAQSAADQADVLMRRVHLEKLAMQRARASACEQALVAATRTIRGINQHVFSMPGDVRRSSTDLVYSMVELLLVDADVSIQLMADRIGGDEVYSHALNVTLLSMMVAKEMQAPPEVIRTVGLGALFHDIGELELPAALLRKHDGLTSAEVRLKQMHCEYGVQIARKLELPAGILPIILQHHERLDGSGYPSGLTGAQMSLASRIVALVNAYDELCNPSDPNQAMTPHEALSLLFSQQSSRFDSKALSTFVRCMGVYPPGTVVELSDDRLAMVVSVNTSKPLRPVVLVYNPAIPKSEALLLDLEHEPTVSVRKTLRPQQLSPEAHAYLSPRTRTTYYFDSEPQPE